MLGLAPSVKGPAFTAIRQCPVHHGTPHAHILWVPATAVAGQQLLGIALSLALTEAAASKCWHISAARVVQMGRLRRCLDQHITEARGRERYGHGKAASDDRSLETRQLAWVVMS